jgi:hypothetical protein
MQYIIFYNECLRSKILYSRFIENNKKNIKHVIKLPINLSSKNKFFLIKKGIFNNNAFSYIFFQFFQTILYNVLSKIFSSNIESFCKKHDLNFTNLKSFPDIKKIKKIIKDYNTKDIIFISTTYILKHKDLNIKNPILNLHEADPREYKGSAIYFRLAKDKKEYMKTVIMEPNAQIDEGRVVLSSKLKRIKNLSVFQIILTGYKLQDILLNEIKRVKVIKKYPKIKNKKKTKIYSFPSRDLEKYLYKNNIKTISIKDFFFILYLSSIKDINKLYLKINIYLNK